MSDDIFNKKHPLEIYLDRYGYSKLYFAKQIPCSYSLPSMWISGSANPSPKMARRIAKVTGGEVPFETWYPPNVEEYDENFD